MSGGMSEVEVSVKELISQDLTDFKTVNVGQTRDVQIHVGSKKLHFYWQ